jgi:hypothetical protein
MNELSVLQANLTTLKSIFRPSSPTDDQSLFRGRRNQLRGVMSGLAEVGQHILIYGERGVGKTSLGYMAKSLFDTGPALHRVSVRIQCADGESFTDIWQDFYLRLRAAVDAKGKELRSHLEGALDSLDEILNYPNSDTLTATDVHRALAVLASDVEVLIIIDEFDRLGAWDETTPFGDLIKSLSDDRLPVTLVIVGVADSIDGLIKAHASTPRSLRQILMPRMEQDELLSIVVDGYAEFGRKAEYELSCDQKAAEVIAQVAEGFPYYAHLLAGAAGTEALYRAEHAIGVEEVFQSMVVAIEDADHTIRSSYVSSTTARADANLETTLMACAMARADELGYFSSTDVAEALSTLLKSKRNSGHVNSHLQKFSSAPHWILDRKEISERKIRYRFHDPLMRPFVLLKGYHQGVLGGGKESESS